MPETNRPLKVFLSYASQDKLLVRELSRRLVGEGWIDTWQDEKSLLPGQDWRVKIEEAVEDADVVIICLSNHSVNKEGYVQKELRYAREISFEKPDETIFLVPLRLDDCTVPRGLRFYQWADYFGEKKEDTYTSLIESLKIRHEQKLKLLEKELARLEIEKQERELAEKNAREKLERDITERIAREEAERIAKEKTRYEAKEKVRKEKLARQITRKTTIEKIFSSFVVQLKPFFRIVGVIVLLGLASIFGLPALVGEPEPTLPVTNTLSVTTFTVTPVVKTPTIIVVATQSFTPTPISTFTPMSTATNPSTPFAEEISDSKNVSMRLIPAGDFYLGDDDDLRSSPEQNLYLPSFYIDKYEVTNKLYKACVDEQVCSPPQNINAIGFINLEYFGNSRFNNYPVVNVDWYMAKTYCEWRDARLPTEAEWEKAARGYSNTYPWGYEADCRRANYRSGNCPESDPPYTLPVGSFEDGKSEYGVYDLIGNVEEWASSLYLSYPYDALDGRENLNIVGSRVTRGGYAIQQLWTSFDRRSGDPNSYWDYLGFRCAKDVDT